VHYGRRVAVDGLALTLDPGEIVGLLGPNGAGKSTALSAIAGGVMPSAGAIVVGGADLAKDPLGAKAKVGFADQPPSLYEFFTVMEHVSFVAEARGSRDDVKPLLERLGLGSIAERPCRELSFGMRQRVGLAAALVGPVSLVLLDETLNGLDPHAARAARDELIATAKRGVAILMSTHLLGVAERLCHRIAIMDKGKLVVDLQDAELDGVLAGGPGAIEELYLSKVSE